MITVRRGITRVVLLVGPWAIKLPRIESHGGGLAGVLWSFTRGVQANLSECEWTGSTGVNPVRWSGAGLVNVYDRAVEVPDVGDAEPDYDGIGFLCPVDRKPMNVGWLRDGRLVWIDYDMSWNDAPPCRERRAPPPDDDVEPMGVVGRDA